MRKIELVRAFAVFEGKRIERTGFCQMYIFTTEKAANRRVKEWSNRPYPNGTGNWPELKMKPILLEITKE